VRFQLLQPRVLFGACAADHPAADSPVVVGHRSPPFSNQEPVRVGAVAAAVVAAAVSRIHRCAVEVVESFQAGLVGDLG
jgi:hypothetical protein